MNKSCNAKPKSRNLESDEIRSQARKADKTSARPHFVHFEISDLGFELQDLCIFQIPLTCQLLQTVQDVVPDPFFIPPFRGIDRHTLKKHAEM